MVNPETALAQLRKELRRERLIKDQLLKALEEMLTAHSMEVVGLGASMRRIEAKERARALLARIRSK